MGLIGVIGAGPAGCAAAHRLALLGHECVLLGRREKKRGVESISPGARHFLEMMQVPDALERIGVHARSTLLKWSSDEAELRPTESFLVDRATFDSLLLSAALDAGVKYVQVSSIDRPVREGIGWRMHAKDDSRNLSWNADYVVIATGRRPFIPSPRRRLLPPLLAICGEWRGSKANLDMVVEAVPDGWLWGAPSGKDHYTAIAFVDPANARRQVRECYMQSLQSSTLLRYIVRRAELTSLRACDASAQCSLRPIGEGWISVGESAFCMEPISSQGVQMALKLGFQGAIVVHNILNGGEDAELARMFYENQIRASATRHQFSASSYYAMPHQFAAQAFWQGRRQLNQEARLGPSEFSLEQPASKQACLVKHGFALREVLAQLDPQVI